MNALLNKSEVVDVRYVAKVLFLCIASFNLGHTFDFMWIGILFALFFVVTGILNAGRRREFAKRPRYSKIPAYGAIVPLAIFWVMTPGVENGFSPNLVFIPGLYLLYLAALQERSRGNGGYETFVAFDGVGALLLSMYMVPSGYGYVGAVGFLLVLFAYSRRGTSAYKYILFLVLVACLGAISYGGWRYWKSHRYAYGAQMAEDFMLRERVMGFDPAVSLGSFGSNYNSRYNDQVVLRVWDDKPSRYLKAASYQKYAAGVWKMPVAPVKTLYPAYYQVDYAVFELADSLTRPDSSHDVKQVWVQSTIPNFGFVFAPYGAIGYAGKNVDSLSYYAGGMVQGLNGNGKRSDWHYFRCDGSACNLPDSLLAYEDGDLFVMNRYLPLVDTVIDAMGLREQGTDSLVLQKMLDYFLTKFNYSLSVPGVRRWGGNTGAREPLSVFWHERRGYCEYYASLSTLVLRRLGIPARYVTGFANPEVPEGLPYYIFRRKHSHAWVEAFADGRWVIFDPTPPILPQFGVRAGWWSLKWEGVRGRFARVMHALKEGEWRRSVDSWQAASAALVGSPVPYAVLVLLVAGIAGRRIYVFRKKNPKRNIAASVRAREWAKKLDRAEREIARYGLHREVGETVGCFVKRIPIDSRYQSSLDVLLAYEKSRWKSDDA